MTRRAVFLDRDGVLNHAVYVDGKSYPPADAESLRLCPGAAEAVARLKAAGYLCICVTNQPDVARGTRTRENVAAMNDKVQGLLKLDDVYVCLHDNADNCDCRKPKPGMLAAAAAKWSIDPAASWMVGDRLSDVAAGKAFGCRTILLVPEGRADHAAGNVCRSLDEVVRTILQQDTADEP